MRALFLTIAMGLICAMQFVPGVGMGEARAACSPVPGYGAGLEGSSITCTYRDQAWAAITAENNYLNTHSPNRFYTISLNTSCGTGLYCYRFTGTSNGYGAPGYQARFASATQCPSGTTWNDTSKTCFGAAACLAKPAFGAQGTLNLSLSDKRCSEGCQFAYEGQRQTLSVRTGATISIGYGGSFKPNGVACAAGDGAPGAGDTSPPSQQCTPAGAGQTYCIKSDGEHCATASTGRQICWRPGETGEKSDGDTLQVRNAGDSPATPTTTPPPGETFASRGTPVTADTSVSGVTITTTTQNYGTTNGTNAGGSASDQGENADGTSGQSPGGQGDSGTGAGDGLNCDDCDNDDGSGAHSGDSIWGADDTQTFTADEAGLGFGASCPAPPTVAGVEMDLAAFCTLMQAIGLLVLAAAHMHALYIIVGD